MSDEGMGKRKRHDQLNYRDWNYRAVYKKTHGLHRRGGFPLDLWVDYILQCCSHYAELYKINYNRGFIEIGEKGGTTYVMAREANGRL